MKYGDPQLRRRSSSQVLTWKQVDGGGQFLNLRYAPIRVGKLKDFYPFFVIFISSGTFHLCCRILICLFLTNLNMPRKFPNRKRNILESYVLRGQKEYGKNSYSIGKTDIVMQLLPQVPNIRQHGDCCFMISLIGNGRSKSMLDQNLEDLEQVLRYTENSSEISI